MLSNTLWPRSEHDRVFRRDGVAELIDAKVYTSEIQWTKPHPEAFQTALTALGQSDPRRAVFVGDRLWDDIHGAQQAGMLRAAQRSSRAPAWTGRRAAGCDRATARRPAADRGRVAPTRLSWPTVTWYREMTRMFDGLPEEGSRGSESPYGGAD